MQRKKQAVMPFGTGSFCENVYQTYLPLCVRRFLHLPAACSLPSPWFLRKTGGLRIVSKVWSSINSLQPKQPEGTVHLEAVSLVESEGAYLYQEFPNILQLQIHIVYLTQLFFFFIFVFLFSMQICDLCCSWQLFYEVQL